jgi:hypothetical protein
VIRFAAPFGLHQVLVGIGLGVVATVAESQPIASDSLTPPAGANVVAVTAREYAFEMPASIPSGLTTFRLRDIGREPHHLMLFRLERGKTTSDALAALKTAAILPTWMHAAGGPNTPVPGGGESNGTVVLEPGQYVVFCMVTGPDLTMHFTKGMVRGLTVVRTNHVPARLPRGDIGVTMRDYSFALSRVPTRGRHVVTVINAGHQAHEMILSRLSPGKTSADFVHWIETQNGPPPVTPVGGTTDIPPGGRMVIQVDLPPGSYSLVCRVRDARDGKPHSAHGMLKDFVVE